MEEMMEGWLRKRNKESMKLISSLMKRIFALMKLHMVCL